MLMEGACMQDGVIMPWAGKIHGKMQDGVIRPWAENIHGKIHYGKGEASMERLSSRHVQEHMLRIITGELEGACRKLFSLLQEHISRVTHLVMRSSMYEGACH